ncbi:MAG: hypothetical protein EB078_08450, partial [Proteobacteria bacterium]|nr:hypothetical protein [Pseudomonadota bacterium]
MKKILFICGSPNQTSMMHKISQHLTDYDCWFTPFYCDGFYQFLQKKGLLDFTIIGGQNRKKTEAYLQQHQLPVDYAGMSHQYDLSLIHI